MITQSGEDLGKDKHKGSLRSFGCQLGWLSPQSSRVLAPGNKFREMTHCPEPAKNEPHWMGENTGAS